MANFDRLAGIQDIEWKYLSYGKVISALRAADVFTRYFEPAGRVLELGCGGGGLSHFFKNYVGLDTAQRALTVAWRTRSANSVQYICGDASSIPLATNSIDVIVSISTIEHMPNPAEAIREAERVCRKGALLIVPCNDTFGFFYDPINYLRRKYDRPPIPFGAFGYGHISVLSKAEWIRLIERGGFIIEAVEPYDDSILTQLEFFCFSLISLGKAYEDLPVKVLPARWFRFVTAFHRVLHILDFRTQSSFCQCFVVRKPVAAR